MVASNTYGRQVVVPLTNKSGGGVIAGDVVAYDSTTNLSFTTTTAASLAIQRATGSRAKWSCVS